MAVDTATAGGHLIYESGEQFEMGRGDVVIVPGGHIKHGNRYELFVVVVTTRIIEYKNVEKVYLNLR